MNNPSRHVVPSRRRADGFPKQSIRANRLKAELHTFLLAALWFLGSLSAFAHQTSQSFLNLHLKNTRVDGRWEIALKDLHYLYDLDTDQNHELTWGEIRRALPRIDQSVLPQLHISSSSLTATNHQIETHAGSAYLVIDFHSKSPISSPLQLDYQFFFAQDPTHRALLNFTSENVTRAAILTSENHTLTLPTNPSPSDSSSSASVLSVSSVVKNFFTEGIWHIWTGFDHILFLLSLLLPAVLHSNHLRPVLTQVAKVVTAFTLAHSITLSLAAFGILLIPSCIVEPIIGASVLLAALNNIKPLWRERGWIVAFAFGLIHGFGFAGALQEVGLARAHLAQCLFLFNAGVETGQLAIVAAFIPIAFALRETQFYRAVILRLGSAAISAIASIWIVERTFNIAIF